jgi:hypothetical protein
MNPRLYKRLLGKKNTYMIITKEEKPSRSLRKIRRRKSWIIGRMDSNLLYLGVVLIHINKAN